MLAIIPLTEFTLYANLVVDFIIGRGGGGGGGGSGGQLQEICKWILSRWVTILYLLSLPAKLGSTITVFVHLDNNVWVGV